MRILSDCNCTRTHNHLVRKRTLNHLAQLVTSSKEFLDIQATIECGFTLKHVRDMIRIYSEMRICLIKRLKGHKKSTKNLLVTNMK